MTQGTREPSDAGAEAEGGEPPCMLDLVCPACGRLGENPDPDRCGGCGEPFPSAGESMESTR